MNSIRTKIIGMVFAGASFATGIFVASAIYRIEIRASRDAVASAGRAHAELISADEQLKRANDELMRADAELRSADAQLKHNCDKLISRQ